ncbi:putative ribonuclease H-like domain-containing protein [Rosa chinensis]|uniref:Putative ribonuclease H-like domain-containing protein n=1 Tax=Rosa chinensis TaxID=74649 RepID=A0A2P6RTJ1_ROSCH|nr:putative ribonuclease H-like domain-containing protein [Rosa chinensis]
MMNTFNLNWEEWILANLMQKGYYKENLSWNIFFIFCCWFLWKWRCKRVFDVNFCYPHNPPEIVFSYATEWFKATVKPNVNMNCHVEMLSWIKPAMGNHKLNVDGSRANNGSIGAGGVIRDDSGCWCGGFMVNIGTGEVLQAEAWGLYHGLHLALSLNITRLEVESDSSILISLIHSDNVGLHPLGTLIMNCRNLLKGFDFIQIKHVHRERNMVADLLAKNSTSHAKGVCIFHDPPALVTEDLLDDIVGAPRARRFNASSAG